MSMKTAMIHSKAGTPKPPTLASRVEKPPVDMVVSAWQSASKTSMPKADRRTISRMVKTA